ncbi:MAG TPA: hypothetical protein VI636_20310 [Candidatus Angelobacter sp.]
MIREVLSSAIFLLPLTLVFLMIVLMRMRAFSDRTVHDVIPYLRNINLEEVKTLLDPATERYLRLHSSRQEFKRYQWKRCHLALQYVSDLSHNAKVFQEWGKYERNRSRQTLDQDIRRASLDLTIACAQCRICALAVRMRIHFWMVKMAVFPFGNPPSFASLPRMGSVELVSYYQQIKTSAIQLSQGYGENYHQKLAHIL